jgi:hypothetical protein
MAFTASNTASCVIAANRACGNGGWAETVACMIAFQSRTESACAVVPGIANMVRNPAASRILFKMEIVI